MAKPKVQIIGQPVREYHSVTLESGKEVYVDIDRIQENTVWRDEISGRVWKSVVDDLRDLAAIVGVDELGRRLEELVVELREAKEASNLSA